MGEEPQLLPSPLLCSLPSPHPPPPVLAPRAPGANRGRRYLCSIRRDLGGRARRNRTRRTRSCRCCRETSTPSAQGLSGSAAAACSACCQCRYAGIAALRAVRSVLCTAALTLISASLESSSRHRVLPLPSGLILQLSPGRAAFRTYSGLGPMTADLTSSLHSGVFKQCVGV